MIHENPLNILYDSEIQEKAQCFRESILRAFQEAEVVKTLESIKKLEEALEASRRWRLNFKETRDFKEAAI